ncbi:MAG: hypothetical protein HQL30_10180 [Candidatus Omnitrophica bacterium]|nr:hypothetical protein [Candidatus Omnitrophota bacterium]
MGRVIRSLVAVSLLSEVWVSGALAEDMALDLLRQGLLGAGSGAIASSVSGGKSDKLWLSALTGAGVNILGGQLLDFITGPKNAEPAYQTVYNEPWSTGQQVVTPVITSAPIQTSYTNVYDQAYNGGYNAGYKEGYKAGYLAGYKEALEENAARI